jgi:multicomponent Na+:H+ antiporter subunit D
MINLTSPGSFLVLLPVLIPLTGAMVALFFYGRPKIQGAWSFGTMLLSLAASVWLLWVVQSSGDAVVFQSGGWTPPFGIVLVGDPLSALFVVMSQIVIAMGILYANGSKDSVVTYPFFYTLFLTLAVGLTGAFLTGDIFNLFVFTELLVISGAALTASSDDRYGTEAAYKYFYISLMAATFLLLAVGSLYVSYGTLNMADLATRIAAQGEEALLLLPAVGFLMAAFMVKSAVFPFHFWQPDFHTAAPTAVHAVLSSVVVKLGIYGFLRMTSLLFLEQAPLIRLILIVMGVIGIIYGGLSAIASYDAKRMLAYSTMAQLGFILVGIGWGTPLSITAAIVFAFNHSLVKSAMLMLAGYVASRGEVKSAAFDVITGVGKTLPAGGVLFFLGSLGLAGIPPTNGFISKALLFRSGIESEHYLTLAIIGLASILTLIYTMRAFQRIWWVIPDKGGKAKPTGDRLLAPAILIGLVLGFGIWADPLVSFAGQVTEWLADPSRYIDAIELVAGG